MDETRYLKPIDWMMACADEAMRQYNEGNALDCCCCGKTLERPIDVVLALSPGYDDAHTYTGECMSAYCHMCMGVEPDMIPNKKETE